MTSKEKILLQEKKAQSQNWVISGEWNKDQTGHKSKENRTGGHGAGVELGSRRRYLCGKDWVGRGPREPGFQKLILA